MDTIALSLKKAAAIIENDFLAKAVSNRYSGWNSELGKSIMSGQYSIDALAKYVETNALSPSAVSGQQELLENQVNQVLYKG